MSCDYWTIPIGRGITEGMKTVYDLLDESKDFLMALTANLFEVLITLKLRERKQSVYTFFKWRL